MESAELQALYEAARADNLRYLAIELAGVFWLAAEWVILGVIRGFRRDVLSRGVSFEPARPGLTRAALRPILLAAAAGTVLTLWRLHAASPVAALQAAALHDPEPEAFAQRVYSIYARHLTGHHLLWSSFVAGWVVLETAILWHGRRAFLAVRYLLTPHPRPAVSGWMYGLVFLGAALAWPAAAGREEIAAAALWRDAGAALQPQQNLMGLYLRAAGLAWIAVEWACLWYLWRGYRLLRAAARRAGV